MSYSQPHTADIWTMAGGQSAAEVIDSGTVSAIAEFARAKGDDIIQTHFEEYLVFSRAAMVQLQERIDSADYGAVELLAHSLRVASLQVGAQKLAAVFEKIEQAAPRKRLDQLNAAAMARLISLHAEVHEVLAAIVENPEIFSKSAR